MKSGMALTGMDSLRRRLRKARGNAQEAVADATEEALQLVYDAARQIVLEEVYHSPRDEGEETPNPGDSDSLYSAFARELSSIVRGVAEGEVTNSAPHAPFLEFGTDDEGTGSHIIPEIRGAVMHWIDGATGQDAFATVIPAHEVKGIKPIRFMSRALQENRPQIVAIYKKHLQGLFR